MLLSSSLCQQTQLYVPATDAETGTTAAQDADGMLARRPQDADGMLSRQPDADSEPDDALRLLILDAAVAWPSLCPRVLVAAAVGCPHCGICH